MPSAEHQNIEDNTVLLPPQLDPLTLAENGKMLSFEKAVFGTQLRVQVVLNSPLPPDEEAARISAIETACMVQIALVDQQMSPWQETSDLNKYNALPSGQSITLPEPMRSVIAHGLDMHTLTKGVFDIGIYGATQAWGFGATPVAKGRPDAAILQDLQRGRDKSALPQLTNDQFEKLAGFNLDLCGIAKGYAVDLLFSIIQKHPDCSAGLVEIGGEFKGFGAKPDGMPWWIELSADDGSNFQRRCMVGLHGWACATSGGANRSFTHEGRVYSHAIDPETLEPVVTDLDSAHVLDRQCWRADALATTLFAMGSQRALAFANAHEIPCLLVKSGEKFADLLPSKSLSDWSDDA